jgi:hypothetical protein
MALEIQIVDFCGRVLINQIAQLVLKITQSLTCYSAALGSSR